MAGIGFRLNTYFKQDSSFGKVKGSIYAIIISSGPWLISILSIALVSVSVRGFLNHFDVTVYKSIISYTYALSLIIFGALEFPLTRYLADKIYICDYSSFKSLYVNMVSFASVASTIIAYIAYSTTNFSLTIIIFSSLFLCSTLATWISMVFLSAARNFSVIVYSFMVSAIISVVLAVIIGKQFGLEGVIIGYSLGQFILASTLGSIILNEFKDSNQSSSEIIEYYKNGKNLILIGLLYYLGIWIDKLLFWYFSGGTQISGPFFTHPYYDTSMFVAYLTIVPSSALFLIKVETEFYTYYKYYFNSIEQKKSLNFLNNASNLIILKLQEAVIGLIKVQMIASVTCWFFLPRLIDFFNLSPMVEVPLKFGIIGAFSQVLFLVFNIILLYFQDTKSVLRNYFLFFLTNTIFTSISIKLGYKYHGMGYCLSSLITVAISYYCINNRLKNLNFYTFMSQPFGSNETSIIR